ncbi:MAG: hypothetical protein QG591_1304 [Planctomycetota bacterium]|jgi:hypothetical protein|nr:hypothetical protein [Planctomycetota bacterium]
MLNIPAALFTKYSILREVSDLAVVLSGQDIDACPR